MTFPAQSPDLRRFPLVAGASRSVVRSPRSAAPRIRFLFVDSRVRFTLRSAYASRRTPCASLRSLRPGSGRTFTSKSSPMPGPPHKKAEAPVFQGLPPSAPPGTRTPNLLIKSQGFRWSHHVSLNPRFVHKSAKSLGFSHIIAYHRVSGRPAISRAIWTPFGRHLDAKGSSRPRLPYRCDSAWLLGASGTRPCRRRI